MINSTVPDIPNLIFKTVTNLFQTIRRESDNRSEMEDTIRTEINSSIDCIALFNQQKEELCQTYNTRLSSLKVSIVTQSDICWSNVGEPNEIRLLVV